MEKACIGCGGLLQNDDKNRPFYTPKPILESDYCQRCYKMIHYNEIIPSSLNEEDYQKMIEHIALKKAFIVMVVDLFDLEGSIMPQLSKLTAHKETLVIANKLDLLPKSVNPSKLRHRVLKRLHENDIKPVDIILTSAKKRYQIDAIIEKIFEYSNGLDTYIVGATNVGKSTLINAFLQASLMKNETFITTSNVRGTTQGFIEIPFEDHRLIDTPGLFNKNHIAKLLSDASYLKLQPKKEIKPQVFQLNPHQSLWFSGLARMDFLEGEGTSFIVYASPDLKIHRQKTENTKEFFEKHRYGLLDLPKENDPYLPFKNHAFRLKKTEKFDIVIPGLLFISIKGNASIRILSPEGVIPYKREALI
ncbi:MAG: ribosome biogenesis GTPase YqeH [Candidatus Izemoplasmataceae bacterium]